MLSWIARVVFLARTLLCVRAEKEKNMFFSIFPFFAGKRYAETKKTRVRSGRERKKKHDFPVFRREKVCRKKSANTCVRAEKENKIFSILPFFRGEKVCRKKCQHVRSGRERIYFFDFSRFSRGNGTEKKNANTCVRVEKDVFRREYRFTENYTC
jgi:hypothetical protein